MTTVRVRVPEGRLVPMRGRAPLTPESTKGGVEVTLGHFARRLLRDGDFIDVDAERGAAKAEAALQADRPRAEAAHLLDMEREAEMARTEGDAAAGERGA